MVEAQPSDGWRQMTARMQLVGILPSPPPPHFGLEEAPFTPLPARGEVGTLRLGRDKRWLPRSLRSLQESIGGEAGSKQLRRRVDGCLCTAGRW